MRFQVPAEVCGEVAANMLTEKLSTLDGVYRVVINRRQRKLSIRFQETVCDFLTLARSLFDIVAEMERRGAFKPEAAAMPKTRKGLIRRQKSKRETSSWLKRKYIDAKETIQAAKIVGKVGLRKQKALLNNPEKAVIDFLNDILVLFLIKLHWQHITQQWIVKPFKYRYEWMAVFYMFYLLVRSRKK